MTMNSSDKLPVFFIPHGGGPWNVMDDSMGDPEGYGKLTEYLKKLGQEFGRKARSLLIISAHWEEPLPTVHFGKNPGMYYDYYGFPEFTYHIRWDAPGNPDLAADVDQLLRASGFKTAHETGRGYDHGTFVPMMVAFPEANIPTVQLSLVQGLDPAIHVAIGKALEPLRSEDVLIICSGMSYHNMRGFMAGGNYVGRVSKQFDDWLTAAIETKDIEKRNELLIHWKDAPAALESHPRSEHLVPLFVAAGAAGEDFGYKNFSGTIMGATVSSFKFG